MSPVPHDEEVALSIQWRIDQDCLRFENAWKAGQRPALEEYLGDTPEPERTLLCRDLIALDIAYRRRAGETPREEEYQARFPNDRELIARIYRKAAPNDPPTSQPEGVSDRTPEKGSYCPGGSRWQPDAVDSGPPDVIGKYRIVEQLGSGGQADVFRAVHPLLRGRDVVIKLAKQRLPEAHQQQLLHEGQALARLEDVGVVRVYDVDVQEGRPFLVMEHIAGRSLRDQLKEQRPPPRAAAALVAQLARTLAKVHGQGVLHRDIKPANILLDASGRPRIVDFGLALMAQPWDESRAPEGQVSGTFQYMAPEQAKGQSQDIGPWTDVFSLGAVLYELLTGRPPYQGATTREVWEQARQAKVVPPRSWDARVPRALERICLKAMAADPEARYATAADLERALRGYLRRPRHIAAGLGLVLLVGVSVLVLRFGFPGQPNLSPAFVQDPKLALVPLEISLRVRVFGDKGFVGYIGDPLPSASFNSDVKIQARLSAPAYCYLLAFDPNGKEELCYPEEETEAPAPVTELIFPSQEKKAFALDQGVGMQTFALLASRAPVPAYSQWQASGGRAPWRPASVETVWRYNGKEYAGAERVVRDLAGLPQPLTALCEFFKGRPGVDALHVIAFPVKP